MEIKHVSSFEKFFSEIELLCEQGYIFRGQPNSEYKYKLIPSAFRDDKQAQFTQDFPIQTPEIRKWFSNSEIIAFISLSFPRCKYPQRLIDPICQYVILLMKYNYFLHKFLTENPNSISEKDRKFIGLRPQSYWIEERSFVVLTYSYFEASLKYYRPDGVLLRDAYIFEELTAVDETYPQHYGLPTAALDWSRDPYIAMYFALDNDHTPQYDPASRIVIASKLPAKYMSLYGFRKIDSSKKHPVAIIEPSLLVTNPRAEKQKGTFTYFQNPCSFFLQNNRFPSIEDYDDSQSFELVKFIIPRNDANLNYLTSLLKERNITKKSLGLE